MTNDYRPPSSAPTARWALWVAIAVLVVAAVLGGFFIIVGDQDDVAGRAWLTLFLVAAFAGAVLLDISAADGPNRWYLAVSIVLNTALVAIGLLKIWAGPGQHTYSSINFDGPIQFFRFLAIVVLVRVALLVTQFYGLAMVLRAKMQLMRGFALAALVFMWLIVVFLGLPASFPGPEWPGWWWRCSGACALIAVVLAAIPLVVRAFESREPRRQFDPNYYPYRGLPGQGTIPPFPAYPQAGYQQAGPPQGGYPQGGAYPPLAYPQATYPRGRYPQGAYPQTGYSQPVYPQVYPQPGYPQTQQVPGGYPQPQGGQAPQQPQPGYPQAQFGVQSEQIQAGSVQPPPEEVPTGYSPPQIPAQNAPQQGAQPPTQQL